MLSLVDSSLVGGIVGGGIDDCSRGLGSALWREQVVEPIVERLDEWLLAYVDVNGMVDLGRLVDCGGVAAVVATVVALVRTRHPPPADRAMDAAAQQVSSCRVDVGHVAHGSVWLHTLPLITIDERLVRPFG